MAYTRTITLLILSALAVCSAALGNSAGRTDLTFSGLEPFLQSLIGGVTGKADRVKTAHLGREEAFRRYAEGPAYLTIKFIVPPHEYENFVNEWSDLEKICVKDQGNIMYGMSKTVTDDVFFLAYSEWESRVDLFYHMISDHFQDFVEYATNSNIVLEVIPMYPATSTKQERRATRKMSSAHTVGKKTRESEDEDEVNFLTHVILKPSEAEDFIDAWEDTASKTYQEEGNAVYSLRRVALKSNEFYIYGTWDSYADLHEHMTSKHVGSLLDFALDRDIVFLRTPLVNYDEPLLGSAPRSA